MIESRIPSQFLLEAYAQGVFPMGMENGEIGWFSPPKRGVIPLSDFHIPHGLKRRLKKQEFEVYLDRDFEAVMRACANRKETWIDENILASYVELYRLGHAHSVECWKNDQLVGGLYGVSLGGAFFGESMFHTETDASKIALVFLVAHLNVRGFVLLDTQWITTHLKQFGAVEISRREYLRQLERAIGLDVQFL